MSENSRKLLKFYATGDELRRIEARQVAAGYSTRAKYLLDAALRSNATDLARIEERIGQIGLILNELALAPERHGPISSCNFGRLVEHFLQACNSIRALEQGNRVWL